MDLPDGIRLATTEEDREAVFRLRYHIYVEELGRYGEVADHENRQLREPVDGVSSLYLSMRDGVTAGTMRLTWGGQASFPGRQQHYYQLKPFLDALAPNQIAVIERVMVASPFRGGDLLLSLLRASAHFAVENDIQILFCDCEPHLLNAYMTLGFRPYDAPNINSADSGYLIPLVLLTGDTDYLETIQSPLAEDFNGKITPLNLPDKIRRNIGAGTSVLSERIGGFAPIWREVYGALSQLEASRGSLFDGLTEKQIQSCLARSTVIELSASDRVIKAGNTSRNIYILLDGVLEVRDGMQVLAVLMPGDVFGEMAFLLESPRSRDVYAVADNTRVISLSETTIRDLIASEPAAAALMMLNIAKMLSRRLAQGA